MKEKKFSDTFIRHPSIEFILLSENAYKKRQQDSSWDSWQFYQTVNIFLLDCHKSDIYPLRNICFSPQTKCQNVVVKKGLKDINNLNEITI